MLDCEDKVRIRWFTRDRGQKPSKQKQARTVQISAACLATPRKFAVNEEYSPTDDSLGSCLFSVSI